MLSKLISTIKYVFMVIIGKVMDVFISVTVSLIFISVAILQDIDKAMVWMNKATKGFHSGFTFSGQRS